VGSDGQKMSKRLKNYPSPDLVLHENGADPLRLYLVDSPAVRAESLRFSQRGVQDLTKDVFLPWLNAFRFFEQNARRIKEALGTSFSFDPAGHCQSANPFDRWILAYAQTLIKFFHEEMQGACLCSRDGVQGRLSVPLCCLSHVHTHTHMYILSIYLSISLLLSFFLSLSLCFFPCCCCCCCCCC
jgi:hypothetical protein